MDTHNNYKTRARSIPRFFILSLTVAIATELPNHNNSPNKILKIQWLVSCRTNKTVATHTTPPIIPKTDPLAIKAALLEPEAIPTIKTAVIITAGNAAKMPARISHGDKTVTK